jgi:hypothetical protein
MGLSTEKASAPGGQAEGRDPEGAGGCGGSGAEKEGQGVKLIDNQIRFDDVSDEYKAFVDKFKPRKTTDDCYTPEAVFDIVADYVTERYGIQREKFVRPFWPGGDYLREEYTGGCCVVDNPPFSIITRIVNDYNRAGIRYFLFAPYLTCFNIRDCTRIVCDAEVIYENGARVKTCFVTNMEPGICARSEPVLYQRIRQAMKKVQEKSQKPEYQYPANVLTATMLGYLANHGISYTLAEREAHLVRTLESQKASGKAIFGCGFLISDGAAARKVEAYAAAAEAPRTEDDGPEKIVWSISAGERAIIENLNGEEAGP